MGTKPVWYQNQNYLSRCTTSHIKFGPEDNIMISAACSSWRPLITGFWAIRQNPLWLHRFEVSKLFLMRIIRVHVNTESQEKEFLNLEIFWCRNCPKFDWKWHDFRLKKIHVPPSSPYFWWNPQKIWRKMVQLFKKSHYTFLI